MSARAPGEEYEDDEEESLVGSNEILFGSNEGEVALQKIWCQVTHPPEGDDIFLRKCSLELTGYAVDHEPESNEFVFVLQKGNETVMWGDSGRIIFGD